MFLSGIVDYPIEKGVIDVEHGFEIAQHVEEQSIVLLKNDKEILPLSSWKRRLLTSLPIIWAYGAT